MVKLENSFGYNSPHLINEWSKSNELSPFQVSKSSAKKFKFDCSKCKSEYECSTDKKTYYESGCPYCRGLKVNDTNSIEKNNPEIMIYWDYEKNKNILPSEVTRNSHKKVFWKCKDCGDETEVKISNKNGCAVCSGQRIMEGYNDLWTTDKKVASLLKNPEDGKKFTRNSNKKAVFSCPSCKKSKNTLISDVTRRGFKCDICDTNCSMGERIISNLLKDSCIEFNKEVRFDWLANKKYDFYVPSYNMIIEVHGEQHYKEGHFKNRSLQEEISNDLFKKEKALENNISYYVELKYDSNNLKLFREEIMSSKLKNIFSLPEDFQLNVHTNSNDGVKAKAWALYEEGMASIKIAEKLNIHCSTAKKYLRIGNELGKCKYPREK